MAKSESARPRPSALIFFVLWLACAALAPPAGADEARNVRMAEVEDARLRGDAKALRAHLDRFEAEFERAGDSASPELIYDTVYTAWRWQHTFRDDPARQDDCRKILERAAARLERGFGETPSDVEARVLLASIRGELADGAGVFARMRLGRQVFTMHTENAELFPEHPRAHLQRAVFWYFVPGAMGGGPEKTLESLAIARKAFEAQGASDTWPNWGRVDVEAWQGQALAALGRDDEARRTYRAALEREPRAAWIRNTLLPALGPAVAAAPPRP